jgi:hypothetical protein
MRASLTVGYLTLGATYGAAFIVAARSSDPGNVWLTVPIAGPWAALLDHQSCGGTSGRSCNAQTVTSSLIVADGVGQALGALLIVGNWFTSSSAAQSRVDGPAPVASLRVSPVSMGSGAYGLLAFGSF